MAVPQNKNELITVIDRNFGLLLKDLERVPEASAGEASMEGHVQGSRMSVADLTAYLVGWNELVLKWLDRDAASLPVDFPETGFKWNQLGALARKFYRDCDGMTYAARLDRLRAAKTRIVDLIEARSDEALYGRPWYGKGTLGRMIQLNTASPYANARRRLAKLRRATSSPR